jgi:tetratricopeptide (TPR) repeat protein
MSTFCCRYSSFSLSLSKSANPSRTACAISVYIEEVTEDEALDLKEKGNAAFKRQDFAEAERLFTEALQLASETAIRAVLLANRSFARMKLARPALALEDAQEAVRLDSKNTKAAFRKGRCELLLGLYDSAAATFKELEQAGCLNDEVSKQIENLNARRREQTSGEYDFAWLYSLPAGSLTECARYVGPIAASDCGDRGRGVVVTRDVRAGELLFADKAFCIEKRAKLAEATVRKLRECPKHQFDAFWALSDGTTVPSIAAAADLLSTRAQRGAENPSGRKVDMDRVRKVLDCNAHAAGTMDIKTGVADESDTSGLFPLGSLVNHSCRPSATRVFLGDLLICRAARDLASGEEVTDSYVSVLQPAFARRSALLDHSGFSIADARSVVEDWCLPQSLAKPLRDRSDKISAEVTAATLGRAVSAFAALAAEVEQFCAERARLAGAPPAVCEAARGLGSVEERTRMLCGNFMPVFVGLAFAARQLGRWEAAAEAYWRCCSFQEENAPYSAYHASWAWELLNAMRKYKGDGAAEPYAAYCRRVFRIYFGSGVFHVVASEARLKQASGDSEGSLPASVESCCCFVNREWLKNYALCAFKHGNLS